ncbi:MAG: hypothetical protein Q8Q14_16160, partial [Gemmatimonadales bacterium]|nr:hypothetical protein [Gemmatimonadales bacterium]
LLRGRLRVRHAWRVRPRPACRGRRASHDLAPGVLGRARGAGVRAMTSWLRAHGLAVLLAFCSACGSGGLLYAAVQSRIAVLEVRVQTIDRLEEKVDRVALIVERIAGKLDARPGRSADGE